MEVVALMSGAQGEEAHQAYKEEDGSHRGHVLDYYFYMVCMNCFSLQLFSRVIFSTSVFPSGNPTFILGGFRVPTQEKYLGYISTS